MITRHVIKEKVNGQLCQIFAQMIEIMMSFNLEIVGFVQSQSCAGTLTTGSVHLLMNVLLDYCFGGWSVIYFRENNVHWVLADDKVLLHGLAATTVIPNHQKENWQQPYQDVESRQVFDCVMRTWKGTKVCKNPDCYCDESVHPKESLIFILSLDTPALNV